MPLMLLRNGSSVFRSAILRRRHRRLAALGLIKHNKFVLIIGPVADAECPGAARPCRGIEPRFVAPSYWLRCKDVITFIKPDVDPISCMQCAQVCIFAIVGLRILMLGYVDLHHRS